MFGEDAEKPSLSCIGSQKVKWHCHSEKSFDKLPCDPEITLLRNYPREIKMYVHTKKCA